MNNVCYSKCPSNSHYDDGIKGKCVCDNLWYIKEHIKVPCLPKSLQECPNEYYFQIYKTKECIIPLETENGCPEDSPYLFNYICYENNCPENTKINEGNKCICDETKGKYYKLENDIGRTYLYCGIKECPIIKPNLLEIKNLCTYNCEEEDTNVENKWAFRGICYKDCPEYTIKKGNENLFKYCAFHDLDDAKDLEELRDFVSVQVKELYEYGPSGGMLYNNFDTSMHIYAFDKNNNIDKELTLKSNLSYIELDTCLNKIYKDQKLGDNDKIYVVKYDLLNSISNSPLSQGDSLDDNTGTGSSGGTNDNNGKDIKKKKIINTI